MQKSRLFILSLLLLLYSLPLTAQDLPELLKQRDEIYFTFSISDRAEIATLTKVISIDNVKGNQVWAYANTKEYIRFMKLGYEITLLPPPGIAPGVVMNDHVVLGPLTTWNYYPTYTEYESIMAQFQTMYPTLCNLDTIGTLASGRRLLVLKISDNVNTDESEPEFFYTSSMHGDEATGYVLMLHLVDYLLSNYGTNAEATELVNNMEIYINPLANPDGTYYPVGNNTISGARRYNNNSVDLNRNYPDPQDGQHPDGNAWQPETVFFMNFASQRHFVASCNFHGGAEVVNYPWDTWATLNADDAWWVYISRQYADTVHLHSPATYMDDLVNGITNGYAWYEVQGGRQDWMNYYQHCREITIELSNVKLIPASQLLTHWDYNWRSLINLMKEARYGIHGIITDQVTGLPVAAKVFILGHDVSNTEVYSSSNLGDYHRPVKAGTWTLEISAPCYQTQTITNVTVADHATLNLNIQLVPGPSAAVTTAAVSAITMSGATGGGNVTCPGQTPVTARGVCWSTTVNPLVTGNHSVNGSGPGTFTSAITGLSPNTVFHVRAYATNTSGTYYGSDIQFTTACDAVTTLPFSEGFGGTTIPACWSQVDNQGNGQVWKFGTITGYTPLPALNGTYAYLNSDAYGSGNAQNADLVTPPLNLTAYATVNLYFKHYFRAYTGSSGSVSYSINNGVTWTSISTFTTTSSSNPAIFNQAVNAVAGQSQVRFKWNYTGSYGYYWGVDDISITGTCNSVPVSVGITASANPVTSGTSVTFTAVAVNGGSTPSYQWKVNGNNAGTNNATYAYSPVNNDQVKCVLTSNAACATGSPATSNIIAMTVQTVPAILPIVGITVTGTQCFDALQTISVAGGGSFFTVQPGGLATMIAGQNILYYPGTIVASGGYLNGHIAPSGPWCSPTDQLSGFDPEDHHQKGLLFFNLYPNPTSGDFTLSLNNSIRKEDYQVEIYNMNGLKIRSAHRLSSENTRFSLAGLPAGIYLVRVISTGQSVAARIVKTN